MDEFMARPLRYEAAGAVYHVMARGDGGMDRVDRFSSIRSRAFCEIFYR